MAWRGAGGALGKAVKMTDSSHTLMPVPCAADENGMPVLRNRVGQREWDGVFALYLAAA